MDEFANPKFCKSILDIAQSYGPYEFWTNNLEPQSNPDAAWRALMVIACLKDPLYAESARVMLAFPDSRVRAWACTALTALNYRPAIAQLQVLINDPSHRVRFHARRAMRVIQGLAPPARQQFHSGPEADIPILISDDDTNILKFYRNSLAHMGYRVQMASAEQETIELALKLHPLVIITDNQKGRDNLSGLNMTWDLCRRRELRDTLIFMITADNVEPIFLWSGGDEYLQKPVDIVALDQKLKAYFYHM